MQNSQIGGGWISPALAAHVEKNAQQPAKSQSQPQPATTTFGGGLVTPQLARHMKQQQMGGGVIHPFLARHIHA